MSKFIIITICCLIFLSGSSQERNLTKKKGILIVENQSELYFIETNKSRLVKLFQNYVDTIEGDLLNASGGGRDFFNQQRKLMKFDSIVLRLEQTDLIEDSAKLYFASGIILYIKENGYQVNTRYKTLIIDNKKIVVKLQCFIPFEKFSLSKR